VGERIQTFEAGPGSKGNTLLLLVEEQVRGPPSVTSEQEVRQLPQRWREMAPRCPKPRPRRLPERIREILGNPVSPFQLANEEPCRTDYRKNEGVGRQADFFCCQPQQFAIIGELWIGKSRRRFR